MWFGLLLLGQVTGILITMTLVGLGFDALFGTAPYALVISVVLGSLAATVVVALKAKRELNG